ncbi:MAG: hypothetical protein QM756_31675 [Polyangiaceae bacterium]
MILAAVYMLSVVQKMFFGPLKNPKNKNLKDMNTREIVAIAPLIALIFVIGFFPNLFLSRMTEGVRVVVDRYENGLRSFRETDPESSTAVLAPRRGGPLERGYPEAPSTGGNEQALNAESGK